MTATEKQRKMMAAGCGEPEEEKADGGEKTSVQPPRPTKKHNSVHCRGSVWLPVLAAISACYEPATWWSARLARRRLMGRERRRLRRSAGGAGGAAG